MRWVGLRRYILSVPKQRKLFYIPSTVYLNILCLKAKFYLPRVPSLHSPVRKTRYWFPFSHPLLSFLSTLNFLLCLLPLACILKMKLNPSPWKFFSLTCLVIFHSPPLLHHKNPVIVPKDILPLSKLVKSLFWLMRYRLGVRSSNTHTLTVFMQIQKEWGLPVKEETKAWMKR